MNDIFEFFKNGIEGFLINSKEKFISNTSYILSNDFDNIFLNNHFIYNIKFTKEILIKNKIDLSIWDYYEKISRKNTKLILHSLKKVNEEITYKINIFQNENNNIQKEKIDNINEEILQYRRKNNYFEEVALVENKTCSANKSQQSEGEDKYCSAEDFIKLQYIEDIRKKLKIIEGPQKMIKKNKHQIKQLQKKLELYEFNISKIKIMMIAIYFIIHQKEIFTDESKNKENLQKFEKYFFKIFNGYEKKEIFFSFIKTFIIQPSLLIYKSQNNFNLLFIKHLSFLIQKIKIEEEDKLLSEKITEIKSYINGIISNPNIFYYQNAFKLLKNDSSINDNKNNQPQKYSRSRGQSLDKNDALSNITNLININNDNKKNQKIDKFFKAIDKKEKDNSYKTNFAFFKQSNLISNYFTKLPNENINFSKKESEVFSFQPPQNQFTQNSSLSLFNMNGSMISNKSFISNNESENEGIKKCLSDKSEYDALSYKCNYGLGSRLSTCNIPIVEKNVRIKPTNCGVEELKKN